MRCKNCNAILLWVGAREGENIFCSKVCAEGYKAAINGFCSACLAETTEESPGRMEIFNFIGTDWGWPLGRKKCPRCGSVILRKWRYFILPIIPEDKYRVLFINTKLKLFGTSTRFLARKMKSRDAQKGFTHQQ